MWRAFVARRLRQDEIFVRGRPGSARAESARQGFMNRKGRGHVPAYIATWEFPSSGMDGKAIRAGRLFVTAVQMEAAMTIPSWLKPAGWGVVLGAVGWWIALAWGFGWMSPGTAAKMAADQSRDAVVAAA